MDFGQFKALIDQIQALGYDRETASDFAMQIGDTPVVDEDGLTLIFDADGERIVARLKLD
jgi:hypothetical protein